MLCTFADVKRICAYGSSRAACRSPRSLMLLQPVQPIYRLTRAADHARPQLYGVDDRAAGPLGYGPSLAFLPQGGVQPMMQSALYPTYAAAGGPAAMMLVRRASAAKCCFCALPCSASPGQRPSACCEHLQSLCALRAAPRCWSFSEDEAALSCRCTWLSRRAWGRRAA